MTLAATLIAATLAASAGPNPIQTENALGGTQPTEWLQPAAPPTSIEGWASEVSVLPGEQVHLHVARVTATGTRSSSIASAGTAAWEHVSSRACRAAAATNWVSTLDRLSRTA
jgi:hypothetical protein